MYADDWASQSSARKEKAVFTNQEFQWKCFPVAEGTDK